MPKHFAIVFNQDRTEGQEPDPQQHWKKGDLYSTGTVIDAAALPKHFDVVPLDGPPGDRTWNPSKRRFEPVIKG